MNKNSEDLEEIDLNVFYSGKMNLNESVDYFYEYLNKKNTKMFKRGGTT